MWPDNPTWGEGFTLRWVAGSSPAVPIGGVPRRGDGQQVGSFVERVADMPLDPVPANLLVIRRCRVERQPDLPVLDRGTRSRLPALPLPADHPGGHTVMQ